jgi:N-acetylglucosaminyldiphosphoundecaprenol N-acetyl-beta-D-mannosaminyltransferase
MIEILGIPINLITPPELLLEIGSSISSKKSLLISNHNIHSVYLWHRTPEVRAFYDSADIVHTDGMPLVFVGRLLGLPVTREHRIAYIDWLPKLLAHAAEKQWRVMFLGSAPGIAEKAAQVFRTQYPTLQLRAEHGYFNPNSESEDCRAVLDEIAEFSPDILLLGMGMPRQELWAQANRQNIAAPVILSSAGATLDYFAGAIPTPPRWSGRLGLEWLFRLIAEPGRLWRRYLVEPWYIARVLLASKISRVPSRWN